MLKDLENKLTATFLSQALATICGTAMRRIREVNSVETAATMEIEHSLKAFLANSQGDEEQNQLPPPPPRARRPIQVSYPKDYPELPSTNAWAKGNSSTGQKSTHQAKSRVQMAVETATTTRKITWRDNLEN